MAEINLCACIRKCTQNQTGIQFAIMLRFPASDLLPVFRGSVISRREIVNLFWPIEVARAIRCLWSAV